MAKAPSEAPPASQFWPSFEKDLSGRAPRFGVLCLHPPPHIVFSLYLPAAAHGPEEFSKALDSFSQDLHILTNATPGCRLVGGADLNTQLAPFGRRIGKHVGTGERP